MKRWIGWGAGGVLWFAGLEGVLQLQKLPAATLGGHDVCGPWGCGPPLPVLVACHGFWLTLIGPAAVLAAVYLPRKWVWRLGIAMAAAGLCGLAGLAVWEAASWLPQASALQRQYLGHRYLFALVTLVDVPIMQFLAIGSGLCLASSLRAAAPRGQPSVVVDVPLNQRLDPTLRRLSASNSARPGAG
jgi:hypothetical protein